MLLGAFCPGFDPKRSRPLAGPRLGRRGPGEMPRTSIVPCASSGNVLRPRYVSAYCALISHRLESHARLGVAEPRPPRGGLPREKALPRRTTATGVGPRLRLGGLADGGPEVADRHFRRQLEPASATG